MFFIFKKLNDCEPILKVDNPLHSLRTFTCSCFILLFTWAYLDTWFLFFKRTITCAHFIICQIFLYSSFTSTLCYVFLCLTSTHSFYLSILSQFVHLLSKTFYRYILSLLVTCLSYWYTIFYTPVYLFGAHFYLCTLSAHVKLLTAVCTYLYF